MLKSISILPVTFFSIFLFVSLSLHGDESKTARIRLDHTSFSPDDDGLQDQLQISVSNLPEWMEDDPVDDWIISIKREDDTVVRTIRADKRWIRPEPTLWNLYSPASDKLRPIMVPETVDWDGRDDGGKILPDGSYRISIRFISNRYDIPGIPPVPVIIHTKKPVVEAEMEQSAIHIPESDEGTDYAWRNRSDRIRVRQSAINASYMKFIISILDQDGDVVFEKINDGVLPADFIWKGEDEDGDFVGYGAYTYRLEAIDRAGNRSSLEIPDIVIFSEKINLDLRADQVRFSPDGNGNRDNVIFRVIPVPESENYFQNWKTRLNIKKWKFVIENDSGDVVFEKRDEKPFPEMLVWNGRTPHGDPLPEGEYFAHATFYTPYQKEETYTRKITLDLTPPDISLSLSGRHFSPDGDGVRDELIFKPRFSDYSGLDYYSMKIYLNPGDQLFLKKPVRVFEGSGQLPRRIVWNGLGELGEVCESLERYEVELSLRDGAGNTSYLHGGIFKTDFLFHENVQGELSLTARIPEQGYFDENQKLTEEGQEFVHELIHALEDYTRYKVTLVVHTRREGLEEENLKKTELRARNLYKEILTGGFDKSRLNYRGAGESELIYKTGDDFAAYRNNRIEVLLTEF